MPDAPRVLVVDDEEKIAQLLGRILEREGYRVASRTDPEAALAEIPSLKPDLVVTDLRMPGMDGLTFARRVRSLDRELPVVLITGYASLDTAVAALKQGVSDYVTKPFSIEEIRNAVGRILANRALAIENRRLVEELTAANEELSRHRRRLAEEVQVAREDLVAANRALSRRLAEMEVLHELGGKIAGAFDLGELLALATRLIREKLGVDATAVLIAEEDGASFTVRGVHGRPGGFADGERRPVAEGIAGDVFARREGVLLPRAGDDPRLAPRELATFGDGSLVALPIPGPNRLSGVLIAGRSSAGAPLGDEDRRLFTLVANDLSVAIRNARLYAENERGYIEILAALVESMEARDLYLRQHSERVRVRSRAIGAALSLSPAQLDVLEVGARLHDLGKVGIPDRILNKPGPLTEEEMAVMRSHPSIGDRIVMPIGKLKAAKPIIRNHHERWDGSGYPDGLAGESIPLLVRIVTVADAYDAMTSNRSYRQAIPRPKALSILKEAAGVHFCPTVVEAFLAIEERRIARARVEVSTGNDAR